MNQSKCRRIVMATALAVAGVFVGANISTSNLALGEVTAKPEPPSFQRGDQIAVPILREIASTLRQMDSRLARLETVAQRLQTQAARNVAAPTTDDSGATN